MALFLVKGTVSTTRYGNDDREANIEIRLVEAGSEREAEEKFEKHYRSKTDEYSIYYSCFDAEAKPVIV